MEGLFPCDLLVFTASPGVPGLDSGVRDVRAAQWEANRTLVAPYARRARAADFAGLFFCQVADPVDPLSRSVFWPAAGTQQAAWTLPACCRSRSKASAWG